MGNGSGVSRGDRNRNARLSRLRVLVPVTNAIVGIDLADKKQMVVVTDHDSKVLARRTFRCHVWDLDAALHWASGQACSHGFAGVTVACEPTGHRWRVLCGQIEKSTMPFSDDVVPLKQASAAHTRPRLNLPSTRLGISEKWSLSSSGRIQSGASCQASGRRNRRIDVAPTDVCRELVDGQGPP
jgi:Tfp pilus assembly protein FimT